MWWRIHLLCFLRAAALGSPEFQESLRPCVLSGFPGCAVKVMVCGLAGSRFSPQISAVSTARSTPTAALWGCNVFFLPTDFSARKKVPQLRSAYFSPGARPRLRASEASGWACRWQQCRAHGPVLGRRSALALAVEQLATRGPRLCPQRRAGPQQKSLPTNVFLSQKTPRRTAGGARRARSRTRSRKKHCARGRSSAEPCQEPHKFHSFLAPAIAELKSQDEELARGRVMKLPLRASSFLRFAGQQRCRPQAEHDSRRKGLAMKALHGGMGGLPRKPSRARAVGL